MTEGGARSLDPTPHGVGEAPLIRVAIIGEEALSRGSTAEVIETQSDLTVVGTAGSSIEAVQLTRNLHPEVVLLDLSLSETTGEAATRSIVEIGRRPPAVLAVTGEIDDDRALAALRAGASGVCTTSDSPDVLVASVRAVAAGDAVVSPPVLRRLLRRFVPPWPLALQVCSNREVEVLGLVVEGATNPEISDRLFISQTTVRTHVQSLRHKLGARNRIDLVVFAYRSGLVAPGTPQCVRALPPVVSRLRANRRFD